MNTPVTSREDILQTAKELIQTQGMAALNMRALAHQCGISVGSIYNYFPTKSDLTIAVVSEIWQEIFHPALLRGTEGDFFLLIDRFAASIRSGIAAYPGFFGSHAVAVEDKAQGRNAMAQCVRHLEQALCRALLADSRIRSGIWSDHFTPEDCAAFVFAFLRADLQQNRDNSVFLKELLLRAIY